MSWESYQCPWRVKKKKKKKVTDNNFSWLSNKLVFRFFYLFLNSKIIFASFLVVCSIAFINAGPLSIVDEGIYTAIHAILKNEYPGEDEKSQCMIDDFRRNHVADKFYTPDLLFNTDKLRREIQPHVDEANLKCTLITFFQSPLGIAALVLLFLLALSIICCLIRCICC